MHIPSVLFVMSSKDRLTLKDGGQHPTGFYAGEFLEPYDTFKQAGYQVEVATPDGLAPTVDPASLDPASLGPETAARFQAGLAGANELQQPRRLSQVQAKNYDIIFVPGGHAPVEDLPYDRDLGALLNQARGANTVVAALCHGPAALLAGVSAQGEWLYQGRQVTSFSKAEEDLTPVAGRMQWELEPALQERGGIYSASAASHPFEGYVVQDGNLITGENPASAALIGPKVVQVARGDAPTHSVVFSVHRDVAGTPEQIWSEIGQFDTLPWHPGLESGSLTTVDGQAERHLVARDGGPTFVERLEETGPHFLRYKMVDGLPAQPVSTFRVEPNGRGASRIVWEADLDTSNLDAATARGLTQGITAFYEAGLEALEQRFGPAV